MIKMMGKLDLTAKFIPPILGGVLVAIMIGGIFIIQEVRSANAEQTEIAEQAFQVEQQQTEQALMDALNSKADIIGSFMAKTAADFILSYDFASLSAFQEEAAKDADVVYSAYLKPDGSAMTDYSKLEDMSQVLEKTYPINYDGDRLGTVLIGMSKSVVASGITASGERIAAAKQQVDLSAQQSMRRFYTIMIADVIAIGVVVSLVVFLLFRFLVVRPLCETTQLVNSLGAGHGDLTVQLPVNSRDEIGKLRIGINAFVASLRDMVYTIAHEVESLGHQSQELTGFSSAVSASSDEQRLQTTQVATAMNEMTATVQEVARNVQAAAQSAEEGKSQAEVGQDVVTKTVASIHHLSNEVDGAAAVITKLEQSSEKIGVVLDVINGIAEQTNLLALNAAIEAARAGEQGRGFAVVADEVRTLASRTHESTLEIREMIGLVQTGSADAVTAMTRGKDAARDSVEQAEKAGESLHSIISVVNQINDMTTQIASAAEEQSLTAEEINRNVESINQLSEQAAEGSVQTSESCVELSNASIRLTDLVGQFKV